MEDRAVRNLAAGTAGGQAAMPGPEAAPGVSVVIPAWQAARTLPETLAAAFSQDYPGPLEVIVADAGGNDAAALAARFPGVRLVANPAGGTSAGLNAALHAARQPVVARCDAHAVLPPGYLSGAVAALRRTGAAGIGGRQRVVARTAFGRAVGRATSSWIGTGGSAYRTARTARVADTVYLGVYERRTLCDAGGFDEDLVRNEDYELNWRLRDGGGTIWFDPALVVDYRPRETPGTLWRQQFAYGVWKRAMLEKHPRSWRARQLAAPGLLCVFAMSAVGVLAAALAGLPGWAALGAAPVVCYALALLAGGVVAAARGDIAAALRVPLALAVIHLAWGAGFLASRVARAVGGAEAAGMAAGVADVVDGARRPGLWGRLAGLEIRRRYRRSVLGPLWLTASIGLTVALLGPLYGRLFGARADDYVPHVAVGLVVWGLINGLLSDGCVAFVEARRIVLGTNLPLSVHVYHQVWRNMLLFGHNVAVVVAVAVLFGVWPGWAGLLAVPGLALICVNGVWGGLLLGALCTRFGDVEPIVASVTRLLFFVTPVLWLPELLPDRAAFVAFNPLHHAVELVRGPLLGRVPGIESWAVVGGFTAAGSSAAIAVFGRCRTRIAYWL